MRRLIIRFLSVLSVFAFLFISVSPAQPADAQTQADEIFQLINAFRAELGLPPFQYNPQLAAAAQQQANWLAQNNIYTHTWPDGTTKEMRAVQAGYNGRVIENIVGGWQMTPRQGLTWWQNSPIHYNTLVTSRYTQAGTGYAFGGDQHQYVLVVGLPSDQPVSSGSSNAAPAAEETVILIVAPIVLAEPAADGSITHTVGTGQSLWTLAAYYDVPLSDLLLFNNYTSESVILQPGDEVVIRLADGQAPPPTPTPPLTHIVQEGQTLWTVAAIYGLSLGDLLLWNGLPEDTLVQPGQELKVRLREGELPPPTATPQLNYIVQPGDGLWNIAARYGLTVDELLALNELPAGAILQPGQELKIRPEAPVNDSAVEATPVPVTEATPLVPDYPPTFTPAPQQVAVAPDLATPTIIAQLPADRSSAENAPANVENTTDLVEAETGRRFPIEWPWLVGGIALLLAMLGGGFLWLSTRSDPTRPL